MAMQATIIGSGGTAGRTLATRLAVGGPI